MTPFEWIAVIGAAAWIPQLLALAYKFVVTPKLYVVPVGNIEVTHNVLGPIINFRAAVIAERKDAVVVQMDLLVVHDRGRSFRLVWDSYVENFSEIRSEAGERGEVSRDQLATALKVNTTWPVEKFFRFRDPEFRDKQREVTALAGEELMRVPEGDAVAVERFLQGKEFTQLLQFHRNSFLWEPGRYYLQLEVKMLGVRRVRTGGTAFTLTEADVDQIRRNMPMVEQRLTEISKRIPAEKLVEPNNWVMPSLEKKEISLGW